MKKIIAGFIAGILVSSLVLGAVASLYVVENPFPVKVNGVVKDIEGYNINNTTYFRLRDVADAVGGLMVDFKDDTIILNDENYTDPGDDPDNKPLSFTTEDGVRADLREGEYYVSSEEIVRYMRRIGIDTTQFMLVGNEVWDGLTPILTDIPMTNYSVPLTYFEETLKPFLLTLPKKGE